MKDKTTPYYEALCELRRREAAVVEQELVITRMLADLYGVKLPDLNAQPAGQIPTAAVAQTAQTTFHARETKGRSRRDGVETITSVIRSLVRPLNGAVFDVEKIRALCAQQRPDQLPRLKNANMLMYQMAYNGEIARAPGGFVVRKLAA